MVKNKIANKWLGMLVAVTMALGMLTNALPVPAGIAEASSATNTTETAFTYASRNVVLDKTAKAYAIDTTATNKMGAEVTKILGNNNNGGKEKAGWISELTDGVFGSFNGAGIAGFNGGNDGRGLGWFVLDAGAQYAVHSVCVDLVHDWGTSDLLIQLSATESFENPITVYSNDVDGSLGYGDMVTGDFSDVYTESIKGGTLMNVLNNGRTFNFAPVSARYIRVTGDAFGNGHRQGYTQFGEIQMFAYETAGTAGPASVAPVTFSSAGGTFSEAAKVTLSAAAGAEIYYTTDGSVPTEKSTKYTGEIDTADFSNACVIRAAAKVNGTMGLPTHGTFAHGFVGNPNVAQGRSVKFYKVDTSAANKMGDELTSSSFKDGQSVSSAVDGNFGDAPLSFRNQEYQDKIPNDNHVYGTGVTKGDGVTPENLWDMKEYFWTVVDFGAVREIGSVQIAFYTGHSHRGVCIQLSTDENFSENVTTVYCDASDLADVTAGANVDGNWTGNNKVLALVEPVKAQYIRVTGWSVDDSRYWTHNVPLEAEGGTESTATNTFYPISDDYETVTEATETEGAVIKEHFYATNLAEVAAMVPTEIQNAALNQSVKFYRVDASAANKMGIELTGSGTRGNLTERTGIFKDGQSFSNAVNGNFSEGSLSIMNADWQNKIPGSSTTGENIYGTGVTTESGGGENLWEMKEYFWTVVDFGESKDIESVQVAFVGDTRGVCIQLSNDPTFTTGVTTVYCDNANLADVTAGANVGGNWANNNKEIKLSSAVNARYIRATGWAVSDARYWTHNVPEAGEAENIDTNTFNAITSDYETLENGQIKEHFIGTNLAEVAAMTALSIKPAPALQAYVTSVNDAFGEAITLESVANGSSANSITENLPEKVTLVGSDGQEHSNVAGTWSAPEGFDGYTAGDYTFTFTPDSTEGLPVDAYGVATVVVTVEAQADLATLNATLETAAAKQETDYTASTWNAFTQAKTAAETVKNATLKTQREVDKANDDLTAAMNALAARADVTELSAELTKHTDKKENQYTTSTWSAFAKAKEAAQAFVNDNSVATQAEVDRAKEKLEAAAAALVLRADTTDLSAAYEAARTAYGTESTSSTYTQQTWSDYLEAMTTAKTIIDDNSNAAQAQADAAKEAIETAIDGFVQKAAQADVDALLAEVTKLRADESKYTVASYAEFKSILGTTEDAVGGAEVTKEAFDAAKAAFDEAKAKLVAVGDATELNALIATKVEARNAYTTASWKTYSEALSAANTAASGGKPQAEIDAAKAALQTAIDGLVKIGDKTALTDLVAKAKAEKEISEDLANAINAAQEVLDKADATQTEVDEAVAALQSALDNNKVSGGCGASMAGSGFAVAFVLAAGACALCLKKRKEKNIQ